MAGAAHFEVKANCSRADERRAHSDEHGTDRGPEPEQMVRRTPALLNIQGENDRGGTPKVRPPSVEILKRGVPEEHDDASRSETSKWWLLGLMSQSPTICDLARLNASRGLWYVLRLRLSA